MLHDRPKLLRAACLSAAYWAELAPRPCRPPTSPHRPLASRHRVAEGIEFFETHIRPVLVEKCYELPFGPGQSAARAACGSIRPSMLRTGGESGPVIVPNKPDESLLISALQYESNEMPPTGKLPDAVIDDFVKWISLGAPDPRAEAAAADDKNHEARSARALGVQAPATSDAAPSRARGRRPLRHRSLRSGASLKRPALSPSPQAPPRALLRRLYYDLTGLPPTAEELDDFAADPSDARYEATVDRLLASPRFGERWARHWLDVARYADTKGYVFTEDRNYKGGYTYRDWVIASFNADRPFDKFVVAQIAADQIGRSIVRAGERLSHARPAVSQ